MRAGRTIFGGHVTSGRPLITVGIVGICVAVWLIELVSAPFLQAVMLSPATGESQPWRFITSAFAHSTNLTHILFNMAALWFLGSALEPMLGRSRFAAIYLLSALGGGIAYLGWAAAQVAANPAPAGANPPLGPLRPEIWYTPLVGASGAVFGLFGVLLVLNRTLGVSSSGVYMTLAVNAALGFMIPNIAWQAHVGGFVVGLICAAVIAYLGGTKRASITSGVTPAAQQVWRMHWIALAGVLVALLMVGYGFYAWVG